METNTYIASNEREDIFFSLDFTYIASNEAPVQSPPEISLPLSIFRNGLSGLEAIVRYLKEVKELRYCEIAALLNRDDRTIWDACQSAEQKSNGLILEHSEFTVPLSIFCERAFGVLEALTAYLKEEKQLRYSRIAALINRDQRTVWTAYSRFRKKRGSHAAQ